MEMQTFQTLPIRKEIYCCYWPSPLSFFNVKDPNSRLFKWRLKLEEYEYNIVYKRGSSNINADALIRIHVADTTPTE
jgi:hypothetical protein